MTKAYSLGKFLTEDIYKSRYYGVYRGIVENDCDPRQEGKVMVRVQIFDNITSNAGIATESLDWAVVCNPSTGSWDSGSFTPPRIGDTVLVVYEAGNPKMPVVLGSLQGVQGAPSVHGISENSSPDQPIPPYETSMGRWEGKDRQSSPRESQLMRNTEPSRSVIFKTQKGHTLHTEDLDDAEYLEMVDRVGQGIRIEGRVNKKDNVGNAEQRGLRTAFTGDQLRYDEKIKDRAVKISIRDVLNQGIDIEGKRKEERIKLQSKHPDFPEDDHPRSEIREFNVGQERQTFELNAGHGIAVQEGLIDGNVRIRARYDSNRPIIELEALGEGSVVIINGKRITVGADTIILEGEVQIDGDTMISGDLTVTGEILAGRGEEGSRNYR